MMKAALIVGGMVATALTAFACSSNNSGGGGNSCFESAQAQESNSACTSCVESKCGSQLSGVESSCSDAINCECPGGSFSASAAASSACQQKAMESGCQSASQSLVTCEEQNCQSQCTTTSSSSSGSSSGSSTSSSGGGTPTGTCATLATCCAGLPNMSEQQACNTTADQNAQSSCSAVLPVYCPDGG